MNGRRASYALFCLAALGFSPSLARAELLSNLLVPGATITSGDKVFSNFQYLAVGDMPTASHVNVVTTTIAGNFGLEFQGGFRSNPGHTSDALIQYVVTSLGGKIIGAYVQGNPKVIGGTGSLVVTDTFVPDVPNSLKIFNIVPPNSSKLTDTTSFAPHQSLHVQKDIHGIGGTGLATLSFVDQAYIQAAIVPEPGSLALLAMGVIGVTAYGWRRRLKASLNS
jgi:hypothetical protein